MHAVDDRRGPNLAGIDAPRAGTSLLGGSTSPFGVDWSGPGLQCTVPGETSVFERFVCFEPAIQHHEREEDAAGEQDEDRQDDRVDPQAVEQKPHRPKEDRAPVPAKLRRGGG